MSPSVPSLTPSEWAKRYFDAYGDKEWYRLDSDLAGNISFRVHRTLLREYVRQGDEVLEVGAGPGRFTREIADLGARVLVTDISREQLRLNRKFVSSHPAYEAAVIDRLQLDVCDLSALEDGRFDAVVAFGGPLSYVYDLADQALDEMTRVAVPGGIIAASVMSQWGALRVYLPAMLASARQNPGELREIERVVATGDLPYDDPGRHACRLYTSQRLRALFESHGLHILRMAASNMLTASTEMKTIAPDAYRSFGPKGELADLLDDDASAALASWETRATGEPGLVDAGTHIIVVARTPGGPGSGNDDLPASRRAEASSP